MALPKTISTIFATIMDKKEREPIMDLLLVLKSLMGRLQLREIIMDVHLNIAQQMLLPLYCQPTRVLLREPVSIRSK